MLTPEEVSAWGWRVAFGIGLLIGPVGFYIRRRIDETPEFRDAAAGKLEKSPFKAVLRRDWRSLLLGIGVVAGSTGFNYVHKVYMPTYALTQLHFPPVSSYLGAAVTGLVQAITGPMFGALSDRVGRYRVLWIAFPAVFLTTYPMFLILNTWPTVTTLDPGAGVGRPVERRLSRADIRAARRDFPDRHPRHRPGAELQSLGDDVRRFRAADRDRDDRGERQQAGAELLCDGDRDAQHRRNSGTGAAHADAARHSALRRSPL